MDKLTLLKEEERQLQQELKTLKKQGRNDERVVDQLRNVQLKIKNINNMT